VADDRVCGNPKVVEPRHGSGGHYLEGYGVRTRSRSRMSPLTCGLERLEKWMRTTSQRIVRQGRATHSRVEALAPKSHRRMSANPTRMVAWYASHWRCLISARFGVEVKKAGATPGQQRLQARQFSPGVVRHKHAELPASFGPDETESNQLQAIYEVGKKVWLGGVLSGGCCIIMRTAQM